MKNNLLGFVFFILAFTSTLFSDDEYMAGLLAHGNKDYKKSFTYFQQAANKGKGDAYLFIGSQYYLGQGVEQNTDEAIIAFENGVKLDCSNCMNRLGRIYNEALRDNKKAVYWYEKAIQSHKYDADTFLALGLIYYDGGYGVTQNKIK